MRVQGHRSTFTVFATAALAVGVLLGRARPVTTTTTPVATQRAGNRRRSHHREWRRHRRYRRRNGHDRRERRDTGGDRRHRRRRAHRRHRQPRPPPRHCVSDHRCSRARLRLPLRARRRPQRRPGPCHRLTYNEDGTELTMNLREGVTFHDGDEFTSADVVASLERLLDEATGSRCAVHCFDRGDHGARRPDGRDGPSVPDATLPAALSDLTRRSMSAASIAAGTVATSPTAPDRLLRRMDQGQQLELDTFADYWGDGPFIDGVTIRVVPEEQSMLSALQAGEVHLGVMGNPAVIEQVSDPLVLERSTAMGYFPFFLNSSRPPLDEGSAPGDLLRHRPPRADRHRAARRGRPDRSVRRGHLHDRGLRRIAVRRTRQRHGAPAADRRRLP